MNKNKKPHGGLRLGAGRKLNSGIYGEPTKVIRVPESKVVDIKRYIIKSETNNIFDIKATKSLLSYQPLKLFEHKVPAGFPSPADDHIEKKLDLNDYLIKQKEATFFVRIKGDSMIDAGIHDNDIVIVDKSQKASNGDIVLASIDGEFTVKLLSSYKSKYRLLAANEKYKPIEINESMQFEVWGVVTGAVRKFK
jgi:DNA polymerase V|tara:strand:+ start:363 stop:944 length:582 start_codon:yes stop_codon:yes gene_type:complete